LAVFNTIVEKKKKTRIKIRKRIRKKISGTADRPRVLVLKSNRYIYIQAIDDTVGHVLAAASTREKDFLAQNKKTKTIKVSEKLGELMAERLKDKKKNAIVFDRGIYPYHGRIKAVAEGMRKGGLTF
jgi:large subunit ribosomal protein L18